MGVAIQVIETIEELRSELKRRRSLGSTVGFVPTMGYLHDGHASLIERAAQECGIVVLSIFVNPTQFGPNEDFDRYPRDTGRDLALAERAGAGIVFLPEVTEMYPRFPDTGRTTVSVGQVTERLCGASRPGHFDGVATVVSKLFHIVEPDFAYFGMKDAQQVAVIEQMVRDLNLQVTIVPCPTLRGDDGLALSSRNVYLNEAEREQALVLNQSLVQADLWLSEHPDDWEGLARRIREAINKAPLAVVDYIEVLSYPSLSTHTEWESQGCPDDQILAAVAVKFGKTRLIDNRLLPIE